MPKKSFSPDIKIKAVRYLEEGLYTKQEICKMFHVSDITLYQWRAKFKYGGVTELLRSAKNKVCSKEFKQSTVRDYLSGNCSMFDIQAKYGVPSLSVFKKWLNFILFIHTNRTSLSR